MKLSRLTEVLNCYNKDFVEKGYDPDVVVRTDDFEELELVDDFCTSISTERDGIYVCLFTFEESKEEGYKISFDDEEEQSFLKKIKNWFIGKWDWIKGL